MEYSAVICWDGHICLLDGWTWGEDDGTHATEEIAAGRYYVRIKDDSPNPHTGPYTLQIRLHPRQDDHGDDTADATEIAVPSVTQGIIATHDDTTSHTYIADRFVFDPQATEVDIFYVDLDEYLNPQERDFEGTLIFESEGDTDLVAKFIRGDGGEWEDLRGGETARNIRIEVPLRGNTIVHEVWPYGWLAVAGHPDTVHHTGPYTVRVSIEARGPAKPGIPRNVRVAEVGEDFIVVEWDPPEGGGAASYNVYDKVGSGTEILLGSVDTLGVRVTGIEDTRERCYRVAAVNADGVEGEKSGEACGRVSGRVEPPGPGEGSGGEGKFCLIERITSGCGYPPGEMVMYMCHDDSAEPCEEAVRRWSDLWCGEARARVVDRYTTRDECKDEGYERALNDDDASWCSSCRR